MHYKHQELTPVRRLVSFWKHHPIADQKAETLAEQTLIFHQKFDCDFIKLSPPGSWHALCYGAEDRWDGDLLGRRLITKTIIKSPQDWLSLPEFDTTQPAFVNEIIKTCQIIKDNPACHKPLLPTVFCPLSQAAQLAGFQLLRQHIETHPEAVLAGLEKITLNTIHTINKLIDTGADGIYFVSQHMKKSTFSSEDYKIFGQPFDEECLNICSNLSFNLFHIHGEDIYFSINNIPSNCFIHHEYSTEITIPNQWQKELSTRILVGMPASEMILCQSEAEMKQLLETKSRGSIITAGCVLPINFPDESISKWLSVSKKQYQCL